MTTRIYLDIRPLLQDNKINPFYNLEYHFLKNFKYPYYIHNIKPILDLLDEKSIPYNIDNLINYLLRVEKHILPNIYQLPTYFKEVRTLGIIDNKYIVLEATYEEGIMKVYLKEYLQTDEVLEKGDMLIEINLNPLIDDFRLKDKEVDIYKVLTELILMGLDIVNDDKVKKESINIISKTVNVDNKKVKDTLDKIDINNNLKYIITYIKEMVKDKDIEHRVIRPYTWIGNKLWVLIKGG